MSLKDEVRWVTKDLLQAESDCTDTDMPVIHVEALLAWLKHELEFYTGNWSGPLNEGLARNGKLELLVQLLAELEGMS